MLQTTCQFTNGEPLNKDGKYHDYISDEHKFIAEHIVTER